MAFFGVGLTLALLVGFYIGFVTFDPAGCCPMPFTLPWIGEIAWADEALSWAAVPIFLVLSVS